MTLDRRAFLRRTSIALAGGLLVGDQALEMFERLTHRPVFALGGLPRKPVWNVGSHHFEPDVERKMVSYDVYLSRSGGIISQRHLGIVPHIIGAAHLGRVEVYASTDARFEHASAGELGRRLAPHGLLA